ncbi:MAG: DUF4112 domain-containing protein [Verrucomicrobia bacterium]|nr:MAG: DUF4112 domain-containing protein [Verrucomicrobiota bacterium]
MKSQIDDSEQKSRGREDFRRQQSKIFEWEVLPPEDRSGSRRTSASLEPLFRWLALIMDEFLRFPGTKIRFGLDPIIGLLPGIGDVSSAIISAVALIHAARYGVPKILLARMATNILINELVGIIPGLGDAFSFWFKSNVRNYQLLRRYSAAPTRSRKGDWIFLVAVLSLLFVIVCTGLIVSLLVLQAMWQLIAGR